MSRNIRPEDLGEAITDTLEVYTQETHKGLAAKISEAVNKLKDRTKATAPKGARGSYKKNIAVDESQLKDSGKGFAGKVLSATWYVKAPDHRLTHLLVHGHATKDGGRTKADPFLQNALDEVLPEYEKAVEEVFKGG